MTSPLRFPPFIPDEQIGRLRPRNPADPDSETCGAVPREVQAVGIPLMTVVLKCCKRLSTGRLDHLVGYPGVSLRFRAGCPLRRTFLVSWLCELLRALSLDQLRVKPHVCSSGAEFLLDDLLLLCSDFSFISLRILKKLTDVHITLEDDGTFFLEAWRTPVVP